MRAAGINPATHIHRDQDEDDMPFETEETPPAGNNEDGNDEAFTEDGDNQMMAIETVQDSNANECGSAVVAKDNISDALVLIDNVGHFNTADDSNENNVQVNISDVEGAIGDHSYEKKRKIGV